MTEQKDLPMMTDPNQQLRINAIIQSLERMCNEARTREVQKDAVIAVLTQQLKEATDKLVKLEPKDAAPKAKGSEQPAAAA